MEEIVIASAARTAVTSFGGKLSTISASKLGSIVIRAVLSRANIAPALIDEVIMGQILTAGAGQNPARQAALSAGIPDTKTALCINQLCGSGLRAVALGSQSLRLKETDFIIAGGQENMSLSPHFTHLRKGVKLGQQKLDDSMLTDGLICAINGYHMGITAENIAKQWHITREQQDEFACLSQNRAEKAQKSGRFKDEIVTVTAVNRKKEAIIDSDEFIRYGMTIDTLSSLKPVFDKNGTVTAGNASGINDGAAALLLMRYTTAESKNIKPLASIKSWATAGVDPAIMGTGPIPASKLALQYAGWTVDDLDLIESNEAFAAQSLSVMKELNFDKEKTNVNGGAIAIGHPIGASGARILVTLIYEMQKRKAKKGLATLCIGGGMGIAICIENLS